MRDRKDFLVEVATRDDGLVGVVKYKYPDNSSNVLKGEIRTVEGTLLCTLDSLSSSFWFVSLRTRLALRRFPRNWGFDGETKPLSLPKEKPLDLVEPIGKIPRRLSKMVDPMIVQTGERQSLD